MTSVILPHVEWIDNNSSEPQMISWRNPSIASLNIDSRIGYGPTDDSSTILITTNNGNPQNPPGELVRNGSRRIALKHLELFFYLDNIISGYNDKITIKLLGVSPDPIRTFTINATLDPGVYTVSELGTEIETQIQNYLNANWGSTPIPTATVTYNAGTSPTDGLLGNLTIQINTHTINLPNISVDPSSSFIANSTSMLVVSATNTYPVPTNNFIRINFFSLAPYNYIDVFSGTLNRNNKCPSSTNNLSNYQTIQRIYSPSYGFNVYDYSEPLRWININKDETLYQIDFKFVDNNGQSIKGAVTTNFWWLAEFLILK